MKTTKDEDKRRQGNGQNLIILKIGLLGQILKNERIYFWVHGHYSWSTFNLHLMRGPKAL